jgi:ketosteroid isomerase-like protein
MTSTLSLETRMQRMEDEKDIRELLVEYGRRLDARDCRGYAELFARDGEWLGGMGRAKGPAGIEAMLVKGLGAVAPDYQNHENFHILTNFQIAVDGDRATAYSRVLYLVKNADNTPAPSRGGHYEDELIREEGRWRFLRRVVMGDIPPQNPLLPAKEE